MNIEKLIGKKVKHKVFGEGIVEEVEGDYIIIKFDQSLGIKKFSCSSSFDRYFNVMDSLEIDQKNIHYKDTSKDYDNPDKETLKKDISFQNRYGFGSSIHYSNRFTSIIDFCDKYKAELISEITYLRKQGGKRQKLFEGKLVERKNSTYIYTFDTDSELNLPDGTQITIWDKEESIAGSIIFCEEFSITLTSSSYLGDTVPTIEFSADPWKLLNSLIERLEELKQKHSSIVYELVSEGRKHVLKNDNISKGQKAALKRALSDPITFIWGPPGTGKTETLASICIAHKKEGHRVLILSHSNVSVDGALLRIVNRDDSLEEGDVLRFGYPKDKWLRDNNFLTTYNYVIQKHADLLNERNQLQFEKQKMSYSQRATHRYIEIQERLNQIRRQLSEEERVAVNNAQIVATTVSKAVIDKTIYEGKFDVVIFDEASMAYVPQIVFSASLAGSHFICMGDFAQLPPIIQSSSDSVLNEDIFHYCGITEAVEKGYSHRWLCLLDIQYRMHPYISDIASRIMYRSLLVSAKDLKEKLSYITKSAPFAGYPIGFLDVSGMMTVCTQTADNSRFNTLSALITIGLALKAAARINVGIITPYHSQSQLFYSMVQDIMKEYPDLNPITCATVHQFQGSEKEMIIYDAVDCYRMKYPGVLLSSMKNNYANRLFNVALTRSKGKFVAVANRSYLCNKNLAKDLMFTKIMDLCVIKKYLSDGEKLNIELSGIKSGVYKWFTETNATEQFLNDLLEAKSEIRIDIPGLIKEDLLFLNELNSALMKAKARGVKVIVRAEDKNRLPYEIKEFAIQNNYIADPISIIDKTLVWFGEPISAANFIVEGRPIETKYRPIIRLVGRHTARTLFGFLEMSKTIDQSKGELLDEHGTLAQYISSMRKCPKCGKQMKLKRSNKNGKFFLGCSGYPSCHNMETITVELIENYFYYNNPQGKFCPQCGRSLEAVKGQYGVYVRCCGISQHKYKLDSI